MAYILAIIAKFVKTYFYLLPVFFKSAFCASSYFSRYDVAYANPTLGFHEMINKTPQAKITQVANSTSIITLVGPRQSGKATLAKYLFRIHTSI